jgi:hypothetical protein
MHIFLTRTLNVIMTIIIPVNMQCQSPAFPKRPPLRVERPANGWCEVTATAVLLSRELTSTYDRTKRRKKIKSKRGVRLTTLFGKDMILEI